METSTLPSAEVIARELAALSEDTDANNWPYRNNILYEVKNYRLWADICLLGIGLASNPILLAWFMLEFVNGWRRQGGLWDIKLAVAMLDAVKLRIDSLSEDHPRRARLTVLWAYHAGWVYHPAGEFSKAAECHRIAVGFATSERDRLLALYNVAYEDLNVALVTGEEGGMMAAYAALEAAGNDLQAQLTSGSDEDTRWRLNLACHRITFAWLCSKECMDPAGELALLEAVPEYLKSAFADVMPLMRAIEAKWCGNSEEALDHTLQEVNDQAFAGWHSLTLLLRAELLAGKGDQASAASAYRDILTLAQCVHGAHLAKALVLRFMAR